MRNFLVLVFGILALVSAESQNVQNCGRTNGRGASGGTSSPLYYPWVVSITDKDGKPFCGGTLISYTSVLTAAHCVSGKSSSDIKLILGVYDLSKAMAGDVYAATKIDVHPGFVELEDRGYENDLAIVGVVAPEGMPNIGPICIFQGWGVSTNNWRRVLGWGVTESGESSQILMQLSLHLTPTAECAKMWSRSMDPGKISCMGRPGQNICKGDDGGPLMAQNDHGFNYKLKGVTSYWGPRCGDKLPGVYMNVEGYKSWIQEHST